MEVLEGTAHTVSGSGTVNPSAGWHSFRISVTDGAGSYGGKLTDDNGKTCALRVKPANGAKTLAFDGENFRLALGNNRPGGVFIIVR